MFEQEEQKTNKSFRTFIKIYRSVNLVRDRFAQALDVDIDRKRDIYVELSQSATLRDLIYWLQMVFAAGITMLGLILNSPAVIIGAMLISPLMNPILSSGLALATGDLILGFRAVLKLALSGLIAIAIAFLIVTVLPFRNETTEIAARTSPNTLDLCIALFSGAIGSVAISREVKGIVTSIPGVAIAVALMPPLCVVGYGIGVALTQNVSAGLKASSGGGLLFLTNLVAITFMAMITFMLLRIDTSKVREKVAAWRETDRESRWWLRVVNSIPALEKAREIRSVSLRLLMILVPLLLISIPLLQSFYSLKAQYNLQQKENRISNKAQELWEEFFEKDAAGKTRSFLDVINVKDGKEKLEIFMRVFDDKIYTPAEKAEYTRLLASNLNRPVDSITFQLVEIPTSARQQKIETVKEEKLPPTVAELQTNYLQSIQTNLADLMLPLPAQMLNYRIINSPDASPLLEVVYLNERDISPDARQLLTNEIKTRMNLQNLIVTFDRVSAEENEIPFRNNSAEFAIVEGGIWQTVGAVMHQHPRLKLAVALKEQNNEELITQRRDAIIKLLKQNWAIDENRIEFSEGETDTFRLFIPK